MLDLFTIVWGEMADSYLELTLPSILQEGNIPAGRESIGNYTFYASDEAKSVITADRLYPQLEKLVPILWQPLQKGEWELNSNILRQMEVSASMKNYMLPLPPDVAMGNKSLSNLTNLINQKFNPVLYAIPRITEEGWEALKSLFKAGEVVSNREMVSLAMKYFWKRAYPIVDKGDHWLVSFPLPAPCLLPDSQLIELFAEDTSSTAFGFDHSLPFSMIERGYPWKVIEHSDIFFGVERKNQILLKKAEELGIWRRARDSDQDKTRQAEEFFVRQSVQTWQGVSGSRKAQDFVSIVICCVDMMEATKRCLESIWANTPAPYELIVVAQACKPETLSWLYGLRQSDKIDFCQSDEPLGAATALNKGFERAWGEYLFTMSNSSVVKKGWLYPLLDTLKNHPEYGWVAAKHIRLGVVMKFSAGALFSKKALFEVGLYDEDFSQGIGFEDDDLLRKFWKAGYQPHAVDESATYCEPPGGSTYKMIYGDKMPEMFRRNQELFSKKWGEEGTDWNAQPVMPSIDPNDVVQGMHRIDWVRSKVSIVDTILEVACAENPVWAGTQFKVTTLDKSVRPEEQCFPDIIGEAESLPFAPNYFDVVSVGELLEHVPEPQVVLREAASVARKKVIVTVPDEYSWPDEFKPFWNPGHIRFYTYSTFQDELKKLGLPFKIWNVKFRGWSHWCAEIYCDNKPEKPERLDASYYNEDYFKPGPKSAYGKPFTWEVEGEEYRGTARSLKDTFRPKNALDVGCAKGFLCKALLEIGIDAYGCDISEFAVNNCEPEVKGRLKVADIRDGLPYPDSSFDLVCSFSTLEHIEMEFLPYVASEMARVAKKRVIINIPVTMGDENEPRGDPSHRTFMPASYWTSLFYNKGLHCDLRASRQEGDDPFQYAQLTFLKGELPRDGDKTVKTEQAKEEETMEYPAKLKEFFESERYWHGDWGYRQGYQDFPIHEQVVELIRSRNPERVLDVGCAMGFIVKRLREKGIDACGVDISNYAISRAPEEVKPYLQVASAHDLPFPPQSFDLIYCASVLEHIPEDFTDKVIAEFKRVAKRAILGIAYKDPYSALDAHSDISHVNIKDEIWWREKLPPEFEMIDVCVEDGKPYTRGLTKLNLGCFGDYYPSWTNIDILPLREQLPPHIRFKQADLRRGLPFCADSSVDLVRMSHLIEHLTLEEAHNLCHEIHRVLKPGALARISTPDASVIIEHYSNGDMGYFNQIQPPEYIQAPTEGERLSRLLFSGDYQHRAVYNFEMLKNFLEQAGFVEIERVSPGFSHSEVMRNETKDQHVEISLTVEAKKEPAPASEIERFMQEKATEIPTSQPTEGIPDYWKQFATGDRMGRG